MTAPIRSAVTAPPAACFARSLPALVLTASREPPASSHAPAPGASSTCPARLPGAKVVLPLLAAGSTQHGPGAWPPALRCWSVAPTRTHVGSATSRSASRLHPAPAAAGSYPEARPSLPAYLLRVPRAPCRALRRLPD